MGSPVDFLLSVPLGTRVVVRRTIESGFTDALGYLRERTASVCVVETRDGMKTVPFDVIVAAKEVPPPPARRTRKTPSNL